MTLQELAASLGVDPATFKPEGVAAFNSYISGVDSRAAEAQQKLEQAQREQSAINEQIARFGVTETRLGELEAANAAYKAAFETVKKSGFNLDLSGLPNPSPNAPIDPQKAMQDQMRTGFSQMGAAMRVQAKYGEVFGKPFTDDPVKLIDEAIASRQSVEDYAENKYKFAAETKRRSEEATKAREAEVAAAAVKKYQEENPHVAGNPAMARGLASRHPQVFKPREAADRASFNRMPAKQRIAESVARGRAMAEAQNA